MTNPNHPAFNPDGYNPDSAGWDTANRAIAYGLTKREYFAAMAMEGMHAHPANETPKTVAVWAIQVADALIVELNKATKP